MKNYIKVLMLSAALLSACDKDYLDITPRDRVVEDQVWNDAALIELYVNGMYEAIPHGFSRHMWSKYTDEAYGDNTWLRGEWNPDNIQNYGEASNWINYYERGYQFIRRANVFLENIESSPVAEERKAALTAQVKFVRAFIYSNLLWRYGGVPIVDEVYQLGEEASFSRASYEEVLNYIIEELDAATPGLPEYIGPGDANFGRATQHAAMALKSRLYLYAASELTNPSHDTELWQKAADAAKAVIDLSTYSLVTPYTDVFLDVNPEIIFARTFNSTTGHDVTFINTNHTYGGYGGWGGRNAPSQNLVDDYEMANGELIFNADGSINPDSGYDPKNPYANRDPRFYETIIYNGDVFRPEARGIASPEYDVTQESSGLDANGNPILTGVVGVDNYKVNGDNSRTSYSLKKFIDRDLVISRDQRYPQPWIFFRLGEIYLNYAEAMFELGNEAVAKEYVNLVRARAGMPPLADNISGDALRDRIRHERRIELAFEGHRFFDVRRWKIAPEVESENLRGVDIFRMPDNSLLFIDKVLIERPQWEDRFYWIPIPRSEINKETGVAQSPGWN
ncbi:RagB/SusD family nutrient uptake outer membrane protein [Cesiribacter sp. SM1]|uniref:RagB/SusD family nutrient uptake outer membrane protein n=1 Tax=Cesiribacter sp. SM1 TaxID=2861196 RepID=UPI001CD74A39|nr:RagB/SusD family nutrient uptake outer membrane protein [Cesiribacter sp. SM1]